MGWAGGGGTNFNLAGSGFTPNSTVTVHFLFLGPDISPVFDPIRTDSSGHYSLNLSANSFYSPGQYEYYAVDDSTLARSPSVYLTITRIGVSVSPSSGPQGQLSMNLALVFFPTVRLPFIS